MTLYLFSLMSHQNRLSEMYTYASRHLKDWFPTLPSYIAFVQRLNQIQDVFVPLIEQLQTKPNNIQQKAYQLIDSMPIPRLIGLTHAGTYDLKAYEQVISALSGSEVYADKAYQTENKSILIKNNITLHTPVKKEKGQKYLDAADQLLSTAISKIRQPIEAFFSWLEENSI